MSTPPVPPDRPDDDPTGVRALLAGLPDPGPMPPDLLARINASIAAEQEARAGSAAGPHGVVVQLRTRRRTWQRAGLVAAAAAAVAVAVPALFSGGSGLTASFNQGSAGDSSAFSAGAEGGATPGETPAGAAATQSGVAPRTQTQPTTDDRVRAGQGNVTLTATGTAYTAAALGAQAVTLAELATDKENAKDLTQVPSSPVRGAATSPAGLRACLTALGVEAWMPVTGDLATFDGHPAVVALVSSDTGQRAYAVRPACDANHPLKLAGPVAVP